MKRKEGNSEKIHRDTFSICISCGLSVQRWYLYCGSCGTANIRFSFLELGLQGFATIEELRKRLCPEWHQLAFPEFEVEDIAAHIAAIREMYPYCPFCGVEILRISLH
jgi:hypothetical protein